MKPRGRINQKQRTRTALVAAALGLLRQGKSPTISQVAIAALVSPATAYRYFPNPRSLWVAVRALAGESTREEVFGELENASLQARVAALIRAVGFRFFDDEVLWRTATRLLHEATSTADRGDASTRIPVLTGQRLRWIRDALAPYESVLPAETQRRLRFALALVMGSEAVVTLRDVCELEPAEAKQLSLWAAEALVRAALAEAKTKAGTPRDKAKSRVPPRAPAGRRAPGATRAK